MKIKYLGTAAAEGWPALFCECEACRRARKLGGRNIRTRSQAIIDDTLLMDFPPDVYMHVLNEGIKLSAVDTLLVTHSHQDHFYPLDLIMRGKPYAHDPIGKVLDIYGNEAVKMLYENAVMKENDSSDLTEIEQYHEIHPLDEFYTKGGYHITALAADHKKNENCLLYLIEKDGKCLLYANDTGWFPEKTWDRLKDKYIDLVSMDCTFGMGYCESNHMGMINNWDVKQKMLQLGCADQETKFVCTHFSHNTNLMHEEFETEAVKYGFLVAYDGFEVEV